MSFIKRSITIILAILTALFICPVSGYEIQQTAQIAHENLNAGITPMATNYYESESNNTTGSANAIPVAKPAGEQSNIIGYISSTSDIDYFKITPPRHGCITVQLLNPSGKSYTLNTYDSSGSPIGTSFTVGGSAVKRFIATRDSALKSYYIKVSSNGTDFSTTSSYTVFVYYTLLYTNLNWAYPLSPNYTENFQIGSSVGYRTSPSIEYHTGVDIRSMEGYDVYSVQSGKVLKRGYTNTGGILYIAIETDDTDPTGLYTTNNIVVRYMHLSDVSDCPQPTNRVAKGVVIGKVGHTGMSSPSEYHLHFDANLYGTYDGPTMRSNPQYLITMVDIYNSYISTYTGEVY